MLGGIEAAHALAYRLVYPQVDGRVLLATGHAYLAWLPLLLGVSGALALVALVAAGIDAAHGRSPRDEGRRDPNPEQPAAPDRADRCAKQAR